MLLDFGRGLSIHAFAKNIGTVSDDSAPQFMQDSTGACPWWGGLLLASWIAHEPHDRFHTRRVIELGCGSAAMPSAAASQRGAEFTLATDGCPSNVHAAGHVLDRGARKGCGARCLAWQDTVSDADRGTWDVVLFADVVYKEDAAGMLVGAVLPLLRPGGMVIGSVGLHRHGSKNIFEAMQGQGFRAQEIQVDRAVLDTAHAASRQLRMSNRMDVMDSLALSNNECKIVCWTLHDDASKGFASHDMTDTLYQEFLCPTRVAAAADEGWIPTE